MSKKKKKSSTTKSDVAAPQQPSAIKPDAAPSQQLETVKLNAITPPQTDVVKPNTTTPEQTDVIKPEAGAPQKIDAIKPDTTPPQSSQVKPQKPVSVKPHKQQRQNTLRDNELKLWEWPLRLWRQLQLQVKRFVGKRLATGSGEENTGVMTMPPPAGTDMAFRLSGVLVGAILLLIVFFGGILGVRIYSMLGMGNNRVKNIPVVYLQGDSTLKFKGPLMETPVTIADRLVFDGTSYSLEKNTVLSQDGKQLLYLDNLSTGRLSTGSGDLLLRNVDREKPRGRDADNRGLPVASGVLQGSFFFVEDDKAVLYLRAQPEGGSTLLRWRDGKGQTLDTGVEQLLGMSKDNYCYYTVQMQDTDENAAALAGKLALRRIGADGVPQTLAQELTGQVLEFRPETGSVLFSLPAPSEEMGSARMTLACWDGSQSAVAAEQAETFVDFSGSNLLFSSDSVTEKSNPMQYFEDDMAAKDAQLMQPTEEEYMVETTNLWGGKKIALDKTAYENAIKEYEAKLVRDEIRKAIAAQERNVRKSTLFYSAGSSKTVVDSDIMQMVDADAATATAIYVKERIPAPQRFKISQVADPMDAIRLLNTVLITTVRDYYYASVGREPELFLSVTKSERVRAELDEGRGLYFIKEDINGAGAPLNYISIQQDGLGVAKKVDDKVIGLTGLRYREQMLYLREDSNADSAMLCGAQGASRERLLEGLPLYPLPIIYGDSLLAYRDYNKGRETGSLTLLDNGKVKPVARAVSRYSYRLPSYIYLLRDYDIGLRQGDLYLYSGNSEKLTLIDQGVSDLKAG